VGAHDKKAYPGLLIPGPHSAVKLFHRSLPVCRTGALASMERMAHRLRIGRVSRRRRPPSHPAGEK
jgi:hypothetical protein